MAISNRTIAHGERAFRESGVDAWSRPESTREADSAIERGTPVLTEEDISF